MKIAVLKFGGHALNEKNSLNVLIKNIKYLNKNNFKVIIAHGGTPTINKRLEKEKIKSEFIDGYRKTTKKIMDVVQEVVLGTEVIEIVKKLNVNGISSIACSGIDANLIKCEKMKSLNNIDYGYVGQIKGINTKLLYTLLESNIIPVISPIGVDDNGNSYNLNSDYLASAVATSVNADYLFMITNINGIYNDLNDKDSRISLLDEDNINNLVNKKIILPVMETKVRACIDYTKNLLNTAYIIDNKTNINHKLLSTDLYGSKIVLKDDDIKIRLALKEDIKDIIKLNHKVFTKYQQEIKYKIDPLTEKYDDVLKDIYNKYVFVATKDNKIIASLRLLITKDVARVSRIAVDSDYQNLGIGSKILKYVENYAYKKGVAHLGLTTLNNVPYLEKFYEKNNYVNVLTNTSRGYERALMMKELGSSLDNVNYQNFL